MKSKEIDIAELTEKLKNIEDRLSRLRSDFEKYQSKRAEASFRMLLQPVSKNQLKTLGYFYLNVTLLYLMLFLSYKYFVPALIKLFKALFG